MDRSRSESFTDKLPEDSCARTDHLSQLDRGEAQIEPGWNLTIEVRAFDWRLSNVLKTGCLGSMTLAIGPDTMIVSSLQSLEQCYPPRSVLDETTIFVSYPSICATAPRKGFPYSPVTPQVMSYAARRTGRVVLSKSLNISSPNVSGLL